MFEIDAKRWTIFFQASSVDLVFQLEHSVPIIDSLHVLPNFVDGGSPTDFLCATPNRMCGRSLFYLLAVGS
jgi:hypothetical protein